MKQTQSISDNSDCTAYTSLRQKKIKNKSSNNLHLNKKFLNNLMLAMFPKKIKRHIQLNKYENTTQNIWNVSSES